MNRTADPLDVAPPTTADAAAGRQPSWPSPVPDMLANGRPQRRVSAPSSATGQTATAPIVSAVRAALAPPSPEMAAVDVPPPIGATRPPDAGEGLPTIAATRPPEAGGGPPTIGTDVTSENGSKDTSPKPTVKMASGPAAILAADPTMVPLATSAPALPATTPAKPSGPVSTPSSAHPFAPEEFDPTHLATSTTSRRRKGRGFGKLLLSLVIVGGLAAAGYVYGPDLYDRWRSEKEDATATAVDEPEAPRAFPATAAAPLAIRSATFRLDGISPASTSAYTVTTDFETTVSRVIIDRKDLPDLEVLTLFDDAVVRRVDQNVWYQVPRGQFPLDDQPQRELWVRHVDEVFPVAVRDGITIEESTRSEVNGVPTRRLVVSVDPTLLARTPAADFGQIDPMTEISTVAGAEGPAPDAAAPSAPPAPVGVDATSAGSSAPSTDVAATDAPTTTASEPAPPPTTTSAAGSSSSEAPAAVEGAVRLELWIDGQGVIRKSSGAPQLGAHTITVLETSAEAWLPEYPSPESLQPLTAESLLVLGL